MIGIDEVGRGCWAGPLLVIAARQKGKMPAGLTDSKLLSRKRRIEILNKLSICCKFGEGWVEVPEIDNLGLAEALRVGVERALSDLQASYEEAIIMDGSVNYVPAYYKNAHCAVDADLKVPIVSAASVYAKVKRDNFMDKLGKVHPAYGFSSHVGYGTKMHKEALLNSGILPEIHRLSFKPVKAIFEAHL